MTIYQRSGDTFTKLENPSTLLANSGLGVAFSPDGNYLVVAHYTSPYISIYKNNTREIITNNCNVPMFDILASKDEYTGIGYAEDDYAVNEIATARKVLI